MNGQGQKARRWPDLSCYDLANPNDLWTVHSILVDVGIVSDSYDGLQFVVTAAVMARRLSTSNQGGYFAQIVRKGFTSFGPADMDRAAAKAILRELDA